MSFRRTRTVTITGTPSYFDLGDLRHLVHEAESLPDSTHVSLTCDRGGSQLDPGGSTLAIIIDETPESTGARP